MEPIKGYQWPITNYTEEEISSKVEQAHNWAKNNITRILTDTKRKSVIDKILTKGATTDGRFYVDLPPEEEVFLKKE